MSTTTPKAQPSQRKLGLLAAGIFAVLMVLGVSIAGRINAPDYGAWTGIRPLETKLEMLEAFAAQGDVDALILGSSITEFGFSARLFSELMSKQLGRPYRAFNFASGGAEPRTLPKLYRLARTVAKAKTVFVVVPAEPKLSEKIPLSSPDHALMNAPVGLVIDHPFLLDFSRIAWNTPALKRAPALRDLAIFGYYKNLAQAVGLESYATDGNGDRLSYLVTWKASDLPIIKENGELAVKPFVDSGAGAAAASRLDRMLEQYFSRRDIAALEELRTLVERDGGKLHVISHAGAASLWGPLTTKPEVEQGRRDFFEALTKKLNAGFWDVAAVTQVPDYAVSDVTHLNVYGAEIFTRNTVAVASGAALPEPHAMSAREEIPSLTIFPTRDITFNPVSALVFRPAGEEHPLLKFRTVMSLAVPNLPKDDLFVGLRMPDGHDVVAPAVALGPGDFVSEVELPSSERPQGIILRLLHGAGPAKIALAAPLEDYEWLHSYPRTPLRAPPAQAPVHVLALPPARVAGQPLFVATSPASPPGEVRLKLAQLDAAQAAPVDLGKPSPAAGQLMKAALPSGLAQGSYELQLYDANGRIVAKAAPLRIEEAPAAFTVPAVRIVEGAGNGPSGVKVAWSGINKPDRQDWIGLFPAHGARETRIDLRYTDGRSSGEMFFTMNRPLQRGEYEFRLFAAGTWRELAATNPFSVGTIPPAEVVAPPTNAAAPPNPAPAPPPPMMAAPGVPTLATEPNPSIAAGSVKVTWSGINQPSPHDWIGIFAANAKAEERIDLVATGGRAAGEVKFPMSSALSQRIGPGLYEFRLYSGGGWKLLARTQPFKFETAVPAPSPGLVLRAGVPRISVDAEPKIASGGVKVEWAGIDTPGPNDWIGVFPVNGKMEDRLDYLLTGGRAAGEVRFPITSALAQRVSSGQYEFRLYTGAWQLLARSNPVKFNASPVSAAGEAGGPARLAADPTTPLQRQFARVTWTIFGKGSDDDWIGLYSMGAKPEERLDFMQLRGKSEGVLEFPISRHIASTLKQGQYEFRLYRRWTLLARSGPVTFTSEPR
jgi:hypothetical protein